MTALLLAGLLCCWSPVVDPDPPGYPPGTASGLSHYELQATYRNIESWYPCPTPEDMTKWCPLYTPFMWHDHQLVSTSFHYLCAEQLGGVCYFRNLVAVDRAGNKSPTAFCCQWEGGCP